MLSPAPHWPNFGGGAHFHAVSMGISRVAAHPLPSFRHGCLYFLPLPPYDFLPSWDRRAGRMWGIFFLKYDGNKIKNRHGYNLSIFTGVLYLGRSRSAQLHQWYAALGDWERFELLDGQRWEIFDYRENLFYRPKTRLSRLQFKNLQKSRGR